MTNIGSKAGNLIRIRDEFSLPVPAFQVASFSTLFANFDEVKRRLESTVNSFLKSGFDSRSTESEISRLIKELRFDEPALQKLHSEIEAQEWNKVSFRTSAALEDNAGNSFAGQYESFVDVEYNKPALRHYLVECFRSMVSSRVIGYAKNQGLTRFDIAGSLIVQEMFYGESSGVLFSEDGSGNISIFYTDGWKNVVVEGADSKHLKIPRSSLTSARANEKFHQLARMALSVEERIGLPVDIEFSLTKNDVKLLQFRPVTVPMLNYVLEWDSTNISENYPGVTLPLTYSTIRKLYAGVYSEFLKMLGVRDSTIKENSAIFDNMLGYLNGHVYYRMSAWYQGLMLLPGKRNKTYFESMLNPVKKSHETSKPSARIDATSVKTMTRFIWLLLRSERLSRKFRDHINERIRFYDSYQTDFLSAQSIIDASKNIRQELLSAWAVPILNDLKLMIFHGILKNSFFKGDHQKEYLDFLQGLTDRSSIKPLQELAKLGATTREAMDSEGVKTLEALRRSAAWNGVKLAAEQYNKHFGARTPDELKLENQRFTDEIASLLQLAIHATDKSIGIENLKANWPKHVSLWKRPLLAWVAKNTKRAIDWRERFRFNRAQTFNLTRNTMNSLAKILVSESIIKTEMDIYWLTDGELDEIVNGHAWSLDVQSIIKQRKSKLSEYQTNEMALAMTGAGLIAPNHLNSVLPKTEGELAGQGVAPGELTAQVVVAKTFDPKLDVQGKILVVPHVDPGWTLLFTQAAGIVAERGNALSHAAIIAREIGIPAVVGAVDATKKLQTGQIIQINGVTGVIRSGKN